MRLGITLLLGTCLIATCAVAASAVAASAVDSLLSMNPMAEAERAFTSGDRRHIVVPVCKGQGGEVIPGWPLEDSPEEQAAIKDGRRPITCLDLGEDSRSQDFQRVAKYAEQYNRKMIELARQTKK